RETSAGQSQPVPAYEGRGAVPPLRLLPSPRLMANRRAVAHLQPNDQLASQRRLLQLPRPHPSQEENASIVHETQTPTNGRRSTHLPAPQEEEEEEAQQQRQQQQPLPVPRRLEGELRGAERMGPLLPPPSP
ncbi:unnamed protein product, partial [Laminaria digitata]